MKSRMAIVAAIAATLACGVAAWSAEEKLGGTELQAPDQASLGGYGELHYNNLDGKGGASDSKMLDFHRFVLFVGYDFSDRVRFVSELELEHSLSGNGKPGEVELEQAYIDFTVTDSHTARAGLFLVPVGMLNLTHEPNTFYGVERNAVEKNIIPTTWWEGGVGAHGWLTEEITYAAYVHSGLMTSSNSSYAVRSGRQKAAKANATDLAGTVSMEWRIPGITLGGAVQYQSGITQDTDASAGSALLGEAHADIRRGSVGLRMLYAHWSLDGDGPESIGADEQYGWYVEPSCRLVDSVGLFARYAEWNNKAGDSGSDGRKVQYDLGVNWWPHSQVVIKADYQWQDNENGKDQSGFNLGLGYAF